MTNLNPKAQLPTPAAFDMAAFDAALAKVLSPEELTKTAFEKALNTPQADDSLLELEKKILITSIAE